MDVGISNARELDYAKQISKGRQMIGIGVITGALWHSLMVVLQVMVLRTVSSVN